MDRQDQMPALVYWGLYGLTSRRAAQGFMWGCFAGGVVSVILAAPELRPSWGMALFLASAWYWYAIRWVDTNSSWQGEK